MENAQIGHGEINSIVLEKLYKDLYDADPKLAYINLSNIKLKNVHRLRPDYSYDCCLTYCYALQEVILANWDVTDVFTGADILQPENWIIGEIGSDNTGENLVRVDISNWKGIYDANGNFLGNITLLDNFFAKFNKYDGGVKVYVDGWRYEGTGDDMRVVGLKNSLGFDVKVQTETTESGETRYFVIPRLEQSTVIVNCLIGFTIVKNYNVNVTFGTTTYLELFNQLPANASYWGYEDYLTKDINQMTLLNGQYIADLSLGQNTPISSVDNVVMIRYQAAAN